MMILPLYALLIWYYCFRHRRRLLGWCALALGLLGMATISMLERTIRAWAGGESGAFTSFQFILYGEMIIVTVGGLFIVLLPRRDAEVPCRKCGYELHGLEEKNPRCPECGLDAAAFKVPHASDAPANISREPSIAPVPNAPVSHAAA
ncbi:MAG: hypothetical protein U0640_10100 [Phycisphaerales bacterium]